MLYRAQTRHYAPVLDAWHRSDDDTCLTHLERDVFGWDHTQVASWMCDAWAFPEHLTEAIGGHHGELHGYTAPPAVRLSALIRDTDDVDSIDRVVAEVEGGYGIGADEVVTMLQESFQDGVTIAQMLTRG